MLKLEGATTVIYDVTDAVFQKSKEGFLFITRDDLYSKGFVVAVPAINFSCTIKEKQKEKDLQRLLKDEARITDRIIRENLVKCIREWIQKGS